MSRRRWWVPAIAATLVAASAGLTGPADASATAPVSPLDGLGRAAAQALGSPSERAWLLAAMDASPFVEHRVPLRQVLMTGRGTAPARAILDRARLGAGEATTIAALPDLELYLPIEAQRRAWHGEAGSTSRCGNRTARTSSTRRTDRRARCRGTTTQGRGSR